MTSYSSMMTPPSSNEDSPPVYFVASPNSSSFQGPEAYEQVMEYSHLNVRPKVYLNNDVMEIEKPQLEIIEQPTDRFRFRYKSEMAGTHGSLTGMNSDKSRKQTYPSVELLNFTGRAVVRCSIYQINAKDKEHMPHAHRLIMKKGKEEQDDPHDLLIGPELNYKACFHGMGIIHTAKKNIVGELVKKKSQLKKEEIARIEQKVRELNTKEVVEIKGLAEAESKSINLNIVCLRFDAFVEQNGILYPICEPVFSHGINNLKSALTGDLRIVRLDHVVCEAKGGKEIFMLVERVTKKNIKIRMYEVNDEDQVVWEDQGRFNDLDVHHQYAIVFKTPKYRDQNIQRPVKVFIELFRPSDDARSEPREFRYLPNKDILPGNKRRRYDYSSSYNSSDYTSDELPSTLNNIKSEVQQHQQQQINAPLFDSPSWNLPENLSDELQKAIADINSAEFKNLFKKNSEEFMSYFTDSPQNVRSSQYQLSRSLNSHYTTELQHPSVVKLEVSVDDKRKAAKFMDELKSFLKACRNSQQRAQGFLISYLGQDKVTNALHILISINRTNEIRFVLMVLKQSNMLCLLDKRNDDELTPLHLAILCRNEALIALLLKLSASVSIADADCNTALHYSVKEGIRLHILECMLQDRPEEKIASFIDLKNNEGDTSLSLAIEKDDLPTVILLCTKGANINEVHPKQGFVPLRLAIEKQHVKIVEYLLSLKHLSVGVEDFSNISPLAAAFQKDCSKDVKDVIQNFININNLLVEIKEEEDDEETEEEADVKPEPMAVEYLEEMYKGVKTFTPKCLDDLSDILDKSNNWGSLSELLGFDYLVSSGMIHDDSMSKAILRYATETSDTSVWVIRNFLESLDETRAVNMIDRMVQEMRFSS